MVSELACSYAALLLADDDIAVTSEKISTILKAAKIDVEPYWPTLFGKALESVDLKKLVTNIGSGVGSAAPAAAGGAAAPAAGKAEEKKEEKKEEKEEEEEDDDMGFGLFD
ncbi:60S acidic ribosomal protein P1 [Tetranychus urticae]|uniref:60S acidic ribosomal protein P1 n=1 Tax=Tetranychus urticae TaxID=32264 RepID=UPI00077BEBC8|nr:60S acidic ribosomal protein P1 [Tetranychus urticae]